MSVSNLDEVMALAALMAYKVIAVLKSVPFAGAKNWYHYRPQNTLRTNWKNHPSLYFQSLSEKFYRSRHRRSGSWLWYRQTWNGLSLILPAWNPVKLTVWSCVTGKPVTQGGVRGRRRSYRLRCILRSARGSQHERYHGTNWVCLLAWR